MELLAATAAVFFLICSALGGGSSELTVPRLSYNVAQAAVSRCRYSSPEVIQRVENHGELVFLHSSHTHITLLSSNSSLSMSTLGLTDCVHVAHLSDIVNRTNELSSHHTIMKRSVAAQSLIGVHWFQSYHNLSSIYHWYRLLANQYPSRVRVVESIGTTQQGRDIMAVHISDWTNGGSTATKRPKVYLQCLMHAREWITGPVCMYAAWNLVTAALSNVADALKKVEFIIVPVLNPDGYELSWFRYPTYRFWRKNVARYTTSTRCAGVDLNRNFNIKWDQSAAGDPCGETYRGPSAASEREVQSVVNHLKANGPVVGGLDFHSFSQIIVYPYGWTTNAPSNAHKLKQAAEQFATQASKLGKKYTVHQMGSIYVASGTFGDWLFSDEFRGHNTDQGGAQVTPVPLTVELRPEDDDTKTYTSFMLPPAEILPSCQEMFPAIVNFASQLVEKQRP